MLAWQLVLAGPLCVVGLLTLRAGWLGRRGRLPLADPRHAARVRAAAIPLMVAGLIAVLGAAAAAAQPTVAAMLTVTVIAWTGAVGLAVATRRLVTAPARSTPASASARSAASAASAGPPPCTSCPLTGAAQVACCSRAQHHALGEL